MNRALTLWIATPLMLLAITSGSYAGEPSTYSPEHCEFTATFPEAPYTTRKCDEEDKARCYDQVSYTKVFDLDTTVNFRLICNKISAEVHENYSGEIMEATLKAMTQNSVVKTFDTTFREEEQYKQAGLVGEGMVGRTSTIYIAQLWIGKKSALSVEAEIIGDSAQEADELFSDVLRSVGLKKTETPKERETKKTEQ